MWIQRRNGLGNFKPAFSALYPSPSALCHLKQNALFYLAVILIALVLKQHYSQAGPGQLEWILKPTAGLVSMVSGHRFLFEAGTGYVCDARRVIIAPGCSGVNFMLMAFGMAAFTGLHHMRRRSHRFIWLMGSLAASYLLTLGVNTLRILVSIHTFHSDFSFRGLTWGEIHRMEGVVIYFFFQMLFYSMIRGVAKKYRLHMRGWKSGLPGRSSIPSIGIRKMAVAGLTPCAWYLAVTLVVPFLNNAPRTTGGRFYDHASVVLGLCLITWICIVVAKLCGQGVRLLFTGGYRKHEAQNPDR
jgi:exosortase K